MVVPLFEDIIAHFQAYMAEFYNVVQSLKGGPYKMII